MERRVMLARFARVCVASLAVSVSLVCLLLLPLSAETQRASWPAAPPDPPQQQQQLVTWVPLTTPPPPSDDPHQLIDLTDFHFVMNVTPCNLSRPPSLLVVVHSAPVHFDKRATIRDTWGSYSDIRVLFMIGLTNNYELQGLLNEEQSVHKDIIQGNFLDRYRNITYKHVMAFKWIKYNCDTIDFVLKTDDDVFINMPNLVNFLPSLPSSGVILCDLIGWAYVKRSWRSKWRVSYEEYAGRYYPAYCSGWAVLYSRDVVHALYAEAQARRFFWVDDVHLTGVLAQKIGVKHIDAKKWIIDEKLFNIIWSEKKWPSSVSGEEYLIGPYNISPLTIRTLWKILLNS